MTTSSTQLGYLDLEAFYMQAKEGWSNAVDPMLSSTANFSYLAKELAEKLMSVIDAIRADGLDPRWHPERDALTGIKLAQHEISDFDANTIIYNLNQRGYKIVKDGEPS